MISSDMEVTAWPSNPLRTRWIYYLCPDYGTVGQQMCLETISRQRLSLIRRLPPLLRYPLSNRNESSLINVVSFQAGLGEYCNFPDATQAVLRTRYPIETRYV